MTDYADDGVPPQGARYLKIDEHGPIQAQLVECGGLPDQEGMVQAVLRLPVQEAKRVGPLLYRWGEWTVTTAKATDHKGSEDQEP